MHSHAQQRTMRIHLSIQTNNQCHSRLSHIIQSLINTQHKEKEKTEEKKK